MAIAERARIRSEVGTEMFGEAFGRAPLDERELAGFIARESRQKTRAVAGFDLTFSPVKSVSALWAVADQATAAAIERAHNAAVADALAFIERRALFTREGRGGVRQVEVRGLVATAFTHRDSRAGDPDLHTHVAVTNKVQTVEGAAGWPSMGGCCSKRSWPPPKRTTRPWSGTWQRRWGPVRGPAGPGSAQASRPGDRRGGPGVE